VRFGYTIIYVRDVAASVTFYERAFGLEQRFRHESGQYAEMETGATALAFAARELAGETVRELADREPAGFEVCLVDEDVEGAYNRAVDSGAQAVSAPEEKPWGQRTAYVRDPDGTLIEIASPTT
jgi:catechol 2,3-dioxygenase-like lactoylglutathione lyase family enzyme